MEQAWLLARMDEQGESNWVLQWHQGGDGLLGTHWLAAILPLWRPETVVGEVVGVLSDTSQWLSLRFSPVNTC